MFRRTLFDPQLLAHFSTPFLTCAPSPMTAPSLIYLSACPSTVFPQGGLCFSHWLNNPLSLVFEPKSLMQVSSDTLRLTYLLEGAVSTRTSTISSTTRTRRTVDCTTVFSGARSKCRPLGVTLSRFASFGKPLSKSKRNRDLESCSFLS